MKKLILAGLGLGLLIGLAGSANATSTGFHFSGHWTSSTLSNSFPVNGDFDGIVRYDPASIAMDDGGEAGSKYDSGYFFLKTITWQAHSDPARIVILNDFGVGGNNSHQKPKDEFIIQCNAQKHLESSSNSLQLDSAAIRLIDNDASVFADESLNVNPAVTGLDLFEQRQLSLWFDNCQYNVIGKIDKLEALPVPEPTTCLLLGTGLAALAGLRRRETNSQHFR